MASADAADKASIAWVETQIELSAYEGTAVEAQMAFTYSGNIENPSLKVVGASADLFSVDMTRIQATSPGHGTATLHVEMPSEVVTDLKANLQWTVDGRPQPQPVHLTVTPKTVDPDIIPEDYGFPSASRIGVSSGGTPIVIDQLVVYVLPNDPAPDETIQEVAASVSGQVVSSVPDMRRYQIRVPGSSSATIDALTDQVEAHPGIESATLDLLGQSSYYTDDAVWQPSQSANADQNWNLQQIHAPAAWDLSTGDGVDVAVIDSGIDSGHPDLIGNLKRNTTTGNGTIDHGTHTAGTVCAQGNNGHDAVGVAFECDLSMYGVYTNDDGEMSMTDLWRRIGTILSLPPADGTGSGGSRAPRVVNLSIVLEVGYDCTSPDLRRKYKNDIKAIETNRAKMADLLKKRSDIMWVFSAGNLGQDSSCSAFGDLGNTEWLPNVISVGASDRNGNSAGYSVRGGGVTVAAPGGISRTPGQGVYSTIPQFCISFGDRCAPVAYGYMSGTSMAAPHVTGTAALAFSADPTLNPTEVKRCLVDGANAGGKRIGGQSYSIINARNTVRCALQTPEVSVVPTVPVRVGQRGEAVLVGDAWNVASIQWLSEPIPNAELSPGMPTIPATLTWSPTTAETVDYSVRVAFNDGSKKDFKGTLQSFAVPPKSLSVVNLESAYVDGKQFGQEYVSKVTFDVIKSAPSDTTPLRWFTDREDPASDIYGYVSGDVNGNSVLDIGESWSYESYFGWYEWEPGNVRTRTIQMGANDTTGAGAFIEAESGVTLFR